MVSVQWDQYPDDEVGFKPKDVGLSNPNIDFLLGTPFDIGWINLEITYNLGVTDSLGENIRTNSHQVQFSTGILF